MSARTTPANACASRAGGKKADSVFDRQRQTTLHYVPAWLHRRNQTKVRKNQRGFGRARKCEVLPVSVRRGPNDLRLRPDCAMMQRLCGVGLFGATGKNCLASGFLFDFCLLANRTRPSESQIWQVQERRRHQFISDPPHGDACPTPSTLVNTSRDRSQIPQCPEEEAWMFDCGCRPTRIDEWGRRVGSGLGGYQTDSGETEPSRSRRTELRTPLADPAVCRCLRCWREEHCDIIIAAMLAPEPLACTPPVMLLRRAEGQGTPQTTRFSTEKKVGCMNAHPALRSGPSSTASR